MEDTMQKQYDQFEKDETISFIEQVFTKPLIKKTLQQIHELEELN